MTLRTSYEIDELLRWPKGRTERLSRKGRIPHVLLPNGERRFDEAKVLAILTDVPVKPTAVALGKPGPAPTAPAEGGK